MSDSRPFNPDWVSPPGETIQDALDEIGLSQAELAGRMGVREEHVTELIKGKIGLTPEIAGKLELVLAESANFWLQREAVYQQRLARRKS